MTVSQTDVTKQGQVDYFNSNLKNLINNATIWFVGSAQISLDCKGDTTGFPFDALGGGKDPGGPTASDLTEAAITAITIANSFHTWARQYTRVRNLRFVRIGNLAGSNTPVDVTRVAHLANSFSVRIASYNTTTQPYTGVQPAAYTDIDATAGENNVLVGLNVTSVGFNAFVNSLFSKWNSLKNNTITVNYDYCHSNCHSSCHSSTRWRR